MTFAGQIAELPFGKEGLTGSKNQSQIRPTQLILANNVTYEGGTIQKEGGAAKYNSTAISGTPSVLAGHDWNHDGGSQRMIVFTDDGKLLKDTGAGDFTVTLKSGLTVAADATAVFVEGGKEAAAGNRKLFIFTPKNVVQVLSADGATTSDVTTPPADWSGANQPTFGAAHEDRIWGGGNENDPHRIYYSDTTNHEDFTGGVSGTISIYPGEGERLLGAISFKGFLICWKHPNGIYAVDTTDPTVANWKVKTINRRIGMSSVGAFDIAEDDIIFIGHDGSLRLLSGIREFGDIGSRSIGDVADINTFMRDNLNRANHHKWRLLYYSRKREVHLAVTGLGATTNDTRLVLSLEGETLRFRTADRDTPVSMWIREDSDTPNLTMGDDSGFVWKLDQETRSQDGVGYQGEFQSSHTDLSFLDPKLGTVRKEGKFLELVMEPTGNFNLNVDILWDAVIKETVTFNMGTTGATLGSFTLGIDKLAGDSVLNKKRRIHGGGRRFSLAARNNGAAQDFSVAKFYLHFLPGSEEL